MTKEQLITRLIQELSDGKPHKKESLIAVISGVNERTLRDAIAEVNKNEILYPDLLIIGLSDRAGYKLVDPIKDKEEIEHFVNERIKRSEETLAPVAKAKRLIKADKQDFTGYTDIYGNLHLF